MKHLVPVVGARPDVVKGARAARLAPASDRAAFAGMLLFTALLFLRPNDLFPEILGTFPLAKVVVVGTVLAYLNARLGRGALTIWPRELTCVLVIASVATVLVPIALAARDSLASLVDVYLKVVCVFVLMINVVDRLSRLRRLVGLAVTCGAVLAVFAVRSYARGEFLAGAGRIQGVVGGLFSDPNDLAAGFAVLFPLAVGLALTRRGVARAMFMGTSVLLACGVFATFSRGGFLGLAAAVAVLLLKLSRRSAMALLLGLPLAGMLWVAQPEAYRAHMASIFDDTNEPDDSSRAQRIALLRRGVYLATHHVVFGIGMGNFRHYTDADKNAHNSYLEIASELGVTGLVAFLVFLAAPIRRLRRMQRGRVDAELQLFSSAFEASIVAYAVCGMFLSLQYVWYGYLVVACAVALGRIGLDDPEERETRSGDTGVTWTRPTGVLWASGRART